MNSKHEDGLAIWRTGREVGEGDIKPVAPAIILHHPKYPHNVGQIVRLASAFGIKQVWFSGTRLRDQGADLMHPQVRLPREERMRAYEDVTLVNHPDPLGEFIKHVRAVTPVAVELRAGSENLPEFDHPEDHNCKLTPPCSGPPVYVFGPEDGSLPGPMIKRCHRFVVIPSYQCLNLSTAVACVLYDRMMKTDDRPSVHGRGVS